MGEIDYSTKGRSEKWKQNVLRNQVVSTLNYNFQEVGNVELTVQSLSPHIILDQIMITVGEEVPFYEFPVQMK